MADVFISYRKADRAKAEALAKALKVENLDVWWDVALETGETFDQKIQGVLEQCKAVIVLWSKESVKSEWVRAESSIGRERGILVPVMIQHVNIPVPFNLLHTADLTGWHGDRAHPGYRDVVREVKELAGKTSVKPLKPPPNRSLRALWRSVAVVGVIAVIGASVWVFRPWEAFRSSTVAALDAEAAAKVEAAEQRVASLGKLDAYGLKPDDFDRYPSLYIAKRIFKPETGDQLTAEAAKSDPMVLALKCAVDLWTLTGDDVSAWEESDAVCAKAADTRDPVGLVVRGEQLMEQSYLSPMGDEARKRTKEMAIGYYKLAADAGYSFGQIRYGVELESGETIPADPVGARVLYEAAMAKGAPEAEYRLGLLLLGLASEMDEAEKAVAMIRKAAEADVQEAQSAMVDIEATSQPTRAELQARLSWLKRCEAGVDAYVAFRCREQIERVERDLAAAPT